MFIINHSSVQTDSISKVPRYKPNGAPKISAMTPSKSPTLEEPWSLPLPVRIRALLNCLLIWRIGMLFWISRVLVRWERLLGELMLLINCGWLQFINACYSCLVLLLSQNSGMDVVERFCEFTSQNVSLYS